MGNINERIGLHLYLSKHACIWFLYITWRFGSLPFGSALTRSMMILSSGFMTAIRDALRIVRRATGSMAVR
eukprot:CAMPEP_0182545418 /NCGR_PEP_ID=MMETSP1323-20130603/34534_1 /TAXON_ID=236787 /ORGANISM="Florenciella parvula, Strain RCC1693" /LENGTH=70 /DNA_ID=CAMNT_0024756571 /DNA_START=92 /DNA_END=300 /DNA_ORIENTATION=+